MNNKGWTLSEVIVMSCILLLALLLSVFLFITNFKQPSSTQKCDSVVNNSDIDKTKAYNNMEVDMINAAKKYMQLKYNDYVNLEEPMYIKIGDLQNEKLLDILYDFKQPSIECDGYVKVANIDSEMRYIPFLKCGSNYESKDYIDLFDVEMQLEQEKSLQEEKND